MKLPFGRSEKPRGVSFPRGSISHAGDGLGQRLRELGVPVHDPVQDALESGRLGTTTSGGGLPAPQVVAGDDLPPGAVVTKAPSVVEKLQGDDDGTVWNGPPEEKR